MPLDVLPALKLLLTYLCLLIKGAHFLTSDGLMVKKNNSECAFFSYKYNKFDVRLLQLHGIGVVK